ncbi:hypothetical protein EI94DRAFT_1723276 [Lactarius quietus]|nr:hypothetical protein EI94DRAFT_1723276 [Lactarius quietus]
MPLPLVAPVFPAGQEPLPPGMTEEDRPNLLQAKKYQDLMASGMESCLVKTAIAGVGGIAIGGFFSMMSTSFAYEDPLLRQNLNTTQKTRKYLRIWVVYRARNDMVNPVAAVLGGGLAFAAFSAAIDLFLRRETAE